MIYSILDKVCRKDSGIGAGSTSAFGRDIRNRPICCRDKASAKMLLLPSICLALKYIPQSILHRTKGLTRPITLLDFDVFLFKIGISPLLSMCSTILLYLNSFDQMRKAKNMGTNSKKVISRIIGQFFHLLGHLKKTQCVPKIAAQPNSNRQHYQCTVQGHRYQPISAH